MGAQPAKYKAPSSSGFPLPFIEHTELYTKKMR